MDYRSIIKEFDKMIVAENVQLKKIYSKLIGESYEDDGEQTNTRQVSLEEKPEMAKDARELFEMDIGNDDSQSDTEKEEVGVADDGEEKTSGDGEKDSETDNKKSNGLMSLEDFFEKANVSPSDTEYVDDVVGSGGDQTTQKDQSVGDDAEDDKSSDNASKEEPVDEQDMPPATACCNESQEEEKVQIDEQEELEVQDDSTEDTEGDSDVEEKTDGRVFEFATEEQKEKCCECDMPKKEDNIKECGQIKK